MKVVLKRIIHISRLITLIYFNSKIKNCIVKIIIDFCRSRNIHAYWEKSGDRTHERKNAILFPVPTFALARVKENELRLLLTYTMIHSVKRNKWQDTLIQSPGYNMFTKFSRMRSLDMFMDGATARAWLEWERRQRNYPCQCRRVEQDRRSYAWSRALPPPSAI